jgi:hypothetical protein
VRIISPFHDFYDAIQKTGQDRSVLYLRRPVEVELSYTALPTFGYTDYYHLRQYRLDIAQHFVGFCGTLYPALRLSISLLTFGHDVEYVAYDADQATAWLAENLPKSAATHLYESNKRDRWYRCYPRHHHFVEAFSKAHEDAPVDLFEQFNAPIFVASSKPTGRDWNVVVNGVLKDLEFYRIKPPQQAFQDLAMWVGGRAQPMKPAPPVSDVVMAEAKGFDRWSFRKEPATTR